ncbi:MAG: sensor histidine kinase, partial [Bacteroidota bacterium]
MFKTKNLSPNQLSLFTSLVLSVPISLLLLYVEKSWLIALICFAVIFLGSYLLILVVLEKFIYRKIKLIYKFIYQTKASKKEEVYYKYILPKKSIDDVREDVEAWAEENKQEIELLRQNEQFRKEFLQNLSHEFKTPV